MIWSLNSLIKSTALFRQDSIQSRDSSWFAYAYAFLNGAWDTSTCLPTYLPTSLPTCLPVYLPI